MKWRLTGVVESIAIERPGAQEVVVSVDRIDQDRTDGQPDPSGCRRALNLVMLTGRVEVGARVLLNTAAVEMGLGTGGLDFIISSPEHVYPEMTPPGHIMKLRYTPLQTPVLAVEAPESPHHDALRLFASLDDMPVVCAELHSQIPAICAAAKWALNEHSRRVPRIVYVMTDGASLPIGLSRLVPHLKECGLVDATITTGQAFGGDFEAVNLYSALAAAKEAAEADIVIVCQGPGNVGTATPLGFSGVDQGLAVNATASLGGIPIAVARISFADPRRRHYGISHHSLTVLKYVARATALVPIPRLPLDEMEILRQVLEETGIAEEHQPITVDADQGLAALDAFSLNVTTMGRGMTQERPFFLSSAAAGLLAAQIVESRGR